MKVAVTVLGRFAVAVDGQAVDPAHWHRRSAAALVKVLALAPEFRLHREQVMDRLWPEVPVDDAAPRLHKAAHYARRALGQARSVVLAGDIVSLFPDLDINVDAVVFQQQADAAISAGDSGRRRPRGRPLRWRPAARRSVRGLDRGRPGAAQVLLRDGAAIGGPLGDPGPRRTRR